MKPEITIKDAILCETEQEFKRLLDLFELDHEFMNWNIYEEKTVLYPLSNQYGESDGKRAKRSNIIKSETLS